MHEEISLMLNCGYIAAAAVKKLGHVESGNINNNDHNMILGGKIISFNLIVFKLINWEKVEKF